MNPAQKIYFENLTLFDHVSTVILAGMNFTGAVLLFRLRKSAVQWLAAGLIVNVALTLRAVLTSNWIRAMPAGGGLGFFIGLSIAAAILLCAIRLKRTGVLA